MFEWLGREADIAFKWFFTSWIGGYIFGLIIATLIYFVTR